jgi:hypothetical protein
MEMFNVRVVGRWEDSTKNSRRQSLVYRPAETFWPGKIILSFLFMTFGRHSFRDLTQMEREYRKSDLDFLLVRPTGLGEDVVPRGQWFLQKEKYKDPIGMKLAKLDAARFMVQEAIRPSLHRQAVVLGSDPEESNQQEKTEL